MNTIELRINEKVEYRIETQHFSTREHIENIKKVMFDVFGIPRQVLRTPVNKFNIVGGFSRFSPTKVHLHFMSEKDADDFMAFLNEGLI